MKKTQAEKEASARYDRKHTKQFIMKLNLKTDEDIIAYLELQDNKQGFMKELIRKEIKKINCATCKNCDLDHYSKPWCLEWDSYVDVNGSCYKGENNEQKKEICD